VHVSRKMIEADATLFFPISSPVNVFPTAGYIRPSIRLRSPLHCAEGDVCMKNTSKSVNIYLPRTYVYMCTYT